MTAAVVDLVTEAEAHGLRLAVVGKRLKAGWPRSVEFESVQPLLARLREHRPEVLALLRERAARIKPEGRCPAGHEPGYWQDAVGQWRCMNCDPHPAWHYLRSVDLDVLGNRPIMLQPPAGDLPAPREWVTVPGGTAAEVVLYRDDGGEILTRTLKGERLAWYTPEQLVSEMDWYRRLA